MSCVKNTILSILNRHAKIYTFKQEELKLVHRNKTKTKKVLYTKNFYQ